VRSDGYIPNNATVALLFYRDAVRFERGGDPAALLEAIFNANGWGKCWRNGVYDFVHYHPGFMKCSASREEGRNSVLAEIRERLSRFVPGTS
jgi:uncharacterized protein YjlB